jgi:UDP-glucose 4-epimerase
MTTTPMSPPFLVTGAAGFIGSHLVDRLLHSGAGVVGVDDLSTGRLSNLAEASRHPSFDFVELDVTSSDFRTLVSRIRPQLVLHLAAQMSVRSSVADPLHDARVNVLGTINVLEAALHAGARKVLLASSGGTVYGQHATLPIAEDTRLLPLSPYGASKVAAECYVETYQRLHGLTGISLALGNVYGPRQDPHGEAGVISIFARALAVGDRTTIFGDGTASRDYVYVSDVVEAFIRCVPDMPFPARLNVGTGTATSVRELHDLLAGTCGSYAIPILEPARAGELQHVSLDSSVLTALTGWRPEVPLLQGLKLTVEWVRASLGSDSSPAAQHRNGEGARPSHPGAH